MKKVVVIFAAVIAFVACSKSDDNGKQEVDPIFSQKYFPLKDAKDLGGGYYQYVGNKIGDRPVGLVTSSAKCKENDLITIFKKNENVIDSIVYLNFRYESKKMDCILSFTSPRTMSSNSLLNEGVLQSTIKEYNWRKPTAIEEEVSPEIKRYKDIKTVYNGNLEIGFQAGYLRIEDYMSDYNKLNGEKVYLYFKKK
ncbi:MAG: hypothetical protein LBE34_03260 [Flavobacteriaceae bacterium]|jgi:hypothetical protein|nr:hypothetical protein [Flavobacteriaceae bacterium]